jgi:UDP-2,3-diacylglucosamine pyrophosphatase LpxH
MSDLHKGNGNAADDFRTAANNYIAAAYYYLQNDFTYIALGDIEELWENNVVQVIANNEASITVEKEFVQKNRFYKVVGNHDLFWKNTPFFANKWLKKMYDICIPIYEGILLKTTVHGKTIDIFLTHGHQGDKTSDGNKFSKWFVANVWSKVQAYLEINPNSPSKDFLLRDTHNKMMYEWSALQKNTILITGHTHKPVFASHNHIEKIQRELAEASRKKDMDKMQEYSSLEPYVLKKPSYYNTGCCCFDDGDITVVEIENDCIRLVKWSTILNEPTKLLLQEISLQEIINEL